MSEEVKNWLVALLRRDVKSELPSPPPGTRGKSVIVKFNGSEWTGKI
jgi:hypothetical protein